MSAYGNSWVLSHTPKWRHQRMRRTGEDHHDFLSRACQGHEEYSGRLLEWLNVTTIGKIIVVAVHEQHCVDFSALGLMKIHQMHRRHVRSHLLYEIVRPPSFDKSPKRYRV